MKRKFYTFDSAAVGMKKFSRSVWSMVRTGLGILAVSVSLFIVVYMVLSLVLSTDTEKRLREENKMYEKAYADIPSRQALLTESIAVLEQKDSRIYEEVFHTKSPGLDPVSSLDFLFGADTIPDYQIVNYTTRKVDALQATAEGVNAAFERIYRTLGEQGYALPPMKNPVGEVSYTQTGATVGPRLNPFYKAEVEHHGLDIIVPRGTLVYSPEAGTVTDVKRSNKGDGNTLTIEHQGGYATRYLHLGEIRVTKGQKVSRGQKIATVGMSGNSYAPHLHYEVLKDGKTCNPVHFLFGSVGPEDYANMLFMSVNTRQSMD